MSDNLERNIVNLFRVVTIMAYLMYTLQSLREDLVVTLLDWHRKLYKEAINLKVL